MEFKSNKRYEDKTNCFYRRQKIMIKLFLIVQDKLYNYVFFRDCKIQAKNLEQ